MKEADDEEGKERREGSMYGLAPADNAAWASPFKQGRDGSTVMSSQEASTGSTFWMRCGRLERESRSRQRC